MTILSLIFSIFFLFLLMRNITSSNELKEYEKGNHGEVLYVMKDSRRSMIVLRIAGAVVALAVIALFVIDIVLYDRFIDVDSTRALSLVLGCLIFAIAPYSTSRWVMTKDGIYIYSSGIFVPWTQMITTGVQKRKGNTFITLQIKKEQGEYLKQAYQLLMVKPEDAERLSSMIREFIHTVDKMKMLKHIKDEKAVEKKKKTWY